MRHSSVINKNHCVTECALLLVLLQFSGSVIVKFHLNDYSNTDDILAQVDELQFDAGKGTID